MMKTGYKSEGPPPPRAESFLPNVLSLSEQLEDGTFAGGGGNVPRIEISALFYLP